MDLKYLSKILAIAFCLSLVGCNTQDNYLISGNAFGSFYFVQIETDEAINKDEIKKNIDNIIYNIDIIASNYSDNSEISRFNNSESTKFIFTSHHLFKILEKSYQISELTNGYFDVTIGDIKIKKGFYANQKKYIKGKTRDFNYKDIVLSKEIRAIRKNKKHINIDLSGIAKGYSVDLIENYLKSIGINDFVINIGGEMKISKRNDELFKISIDDPSNNIQTIEDIYMTSGAVATSGTYQDFVKYKGKEISHIINPKKLENISDLSLLITVVHDNCATADALATGFIAMEHDRIIDFANQNDIALMFLKNKEGSIEKKYSKKFIKYLSDGD